MMSKLRLAMIVLFCSGFAGSAVAQLDASALRARLGDPLNRQIFHQPAGFDVTVDYGPGNSVCRIQVPAAMPSTEKVSNAIEMKQRMRAFLDSLVPAQMRGKEIQQSAMMSGLLSVSYVQYEHVSVSESQNANDAFAGTITVTFLNEGCHRASAQ
jgi:hypothetical protein